MIFIGIPLIVKPIIVCTSGGTGRPSIRRAGEPSPYELFISLFVFPVGLGDPAPTSFLLFYYTEFAGTLETVAVGCSEEVESGADHFAACVCAIPFGGIVQHFN